MRFPLVWTPCYLDRDSSRFHFPRRDGIGIEKRCTPVQSHSFPRLSDPRRGRRVPLSLSPSSSPRSREYYIYSPAFSPVPLKSTPLRLKTVRCDFFSLVSIHVSVFINPFIVNNSLKKVFFFVLNYLPCATIILNIRKKIDRRSFVF